MDTLRKVLVIRHFTLTIISMKMKKKKKVKNVNLKRKYATTTLRSVIIMVISK